MTTMPVAVAASEVVDVDAVDVAASAPASPAAADAPASSSWRDRTGVSC